MIRPSASNGFILLDIVIEYNAMGRMNCKFSHIVSQFERAYHTLVLLDHTTIDREMSVVFCAVLCIRMGFVCLSLNNCALRRHLGQ